eukprot:1600111-Pyramimonas_sp.AAC.1
MSSERTSVPPTGGRRSATWRARAPSTCAEGKRGTEQILAAMRDMIVARQFRARRIGRAAT